MHFHFCCAVLAVVASSSTAIPGLRNQSLCMSFWRRTTDSKIASDTKFFLCRMQAMVTESKKPEPCTVPSVKHGEVRKLKSSRFWGNRSYELVYEIQAGERIADAESVILSCAKGYLPAGSTQISKVLRFKEISVTCKDGIWSNPLLCEAETTCGEPPPTEFAMITSLFIEAYELGAVVAYECQPGYVIKGRTTTSQCVMSDDGSRAVWTKVPMSCSEITCGEPPPIEFARVTSLFTEDYPLGAVVAYECQPGYVVEGSTTSSQCLISNDGSQAFWTKVPMSCTAQARHCPKIERKDIFNIYYSNGTNINSTVHYSCKSILEKINGPVFRTCLSNGRWSGTDPLCTSPGLKCPVIDERGIFDVTYTNDRRINSIAVYSCKDFGNEVSGSSIRYCLKSGQWSGSDPVCVLLM